MKKLDLKDCKYGRLLVTNEAPNVNGRTAWECICDCGKKVVVTTHSLRRGNTKSCGCLAKETASKNYTTHGAGYEPWIAQWRAMVRRTTNPKDVAYEHYVLTKKLTIDDDFVANPWAFYEEIGEFPGKGYTIDRIDNEKGYIKGNLRWVTQAENNMNKSLYKNNKSGTSGILWDKKRQQWKVDKRHNNKRYYGGRYDDLKDAEKALNSILEEIGLGD